VGGTATQFSVFAQDEYQVNSRLTLSYGLRWQILPGFQEDGGNLANFDQRNNSIVVANALTGYLVQQDITPSNVALSMRSERASAPEVRLSKGSLSNVTTMFRLPKPTHFGLGVLKTYHPL
jgi:hypothetical protein